MSTYIQKKEVGNTGEKTSKKDREREKNSKKISVQKILEVEKSIWKGRIRKNTHQEAMEPCDRAERRICAKKKKSIFAIKREKKGDTSICKELTTKRIYLAIKITIDLTSAFIAKKNGTRLLCKLMDSKEQVPLTSNYKYPRWSRKEDIHKT